MEVSQIVDTDFFTPQQLHDIMATALRHAAQLADETGNVSVSLVELARNASDARIYVEQMARATKASGK